MIDCEDRRSTPQVWNLKKILVLAFALNGSALSSRLAMEQRQNVAFDFVPQKTAVVARIRRTSDGGGITSGDHSTMHVQTIYPAPTNDYGVKFSGAQ